jgi:hypothetical protein
VDLSTATNESTCQARVVTDVGTDIQKGLTILQSMPQECFCTALMRDLAVDEVRRAHPEAEVEQQRVPSIQIRLVRAKGWNRSCRNLQNMRPATRYDPCPCSNEFLENRHLCAGVDVLSGADGDRKKAEEVIS